MNDPSNLPAVARTALFQAAMGYLDRDDLIGFRRAVADLDDLKLTHTFLGGLLAREAGKLWIGDGFENVTDSRLLRGEADGDLLVCNTIGGGTLLRSGGSCVREKQPQAPWNHWSDRTWRGALQPRVNSTLVDGVFVESVLLGPTHGSVHLFTTAAAAELVRVGPAEANANGNEIWRRVVPIDGEPDWAPPRALWASTGYILLALASRRFVTLDAATGEIIARSEPKSGLLRVLDYSAKVGVLVECALGFPTEETKLAGMDGLSLVPFPISSHYKIFQARELVDAVWRGDSLMILLAGQKGSLISRSENFIWPPRKAVESRGKEFSEIQRLIAAECDARLAGDLGEAAFSWSRTVTVVRVALGSNSTEGALTPAIAARGSGEVLRWVDEEVPKRHTKEYRRPMGISSVPEVADLLHRGCGGPIWISRDGSTAFLASGWGFNVIDVRTGDLISGFKFSSGEIRTNNAFTGDGHHERMEQRWSKPTSNPYLLEPDGYPTPTCVWMDPRGAMVIATWGEESFGLSLEDGLLYQFKHPGYSWFATDGEGRALFVSRIGVHEISFGLAPRVAPCPWFASLLKNAVSDTNARHLVIGRNLGEVAIGELVTVIAADVERVLAMSCCGTRMIAITRNYRAVLLARDQGSAWFAVPLEAADVLGDSHSACCAFTPDSQHLVARTKDSLRFWCCSTGRNVLRIPCVNMESLDSACFSACGRILLVSSSDSVERWETREAAISNATDIRRARAKCFAEINRIRESQGIRAACEHCKVDVGVDVERDVPVLQRMLFAVRQGWMDHPMIHSSSLISDWMY